MKIEIPEPVLAVGYAKSVWITVANFEFTITYDDGTVVTYIIPAGFVTDFYSIPRFLHWWRSNNEGWGAEASLIHDFLRRYYKDFDMIRLYLPVYFKSRRVLVFFTVESVGQIEPN